MISTFLPEDVTLLLKDITGMVEPLPTKEREKYIQKGVHYSEMLPLEYVPSDEYLKEYNNALNTFSSVTANAIMSVSEKIYKLKGDSLVLVSLARAGTPIGILIKRYLQKKYSINVAHYSISIIRGKGIDNNAMKYILKHHNPIHLQFIDGWIGKGAILNELHKEIKNYKGVDSRLAVLSDPANITELYGSSDDFLIPSACLNCTVCGLISRTFYRKDIISDSDFHGAAFYKEFIEHDKTYEFINKIESFFNYDNLYKEKDNNTNNSTLGIDEVNNIAKHFNVDNINFIKPGVGETTRVLLRRVPDIVLISDNANKKYIRHILRLAEEKNVSVINFPLKKYQSCGIIKKIGADV